MSNRKEYQKQYRKKYKAKKRQVSGYLSLKNFRDLEQRSKDGGRSNFQQLYQESQAYLDNHYLPNKTQLELQRQLIIEVRRIGCNINQQTRYVNSFKRLIAQRQVFARLQELEQVINDFILNPASK